MTLSVVVLSIFLKEVMTNSISDPVVSYMSTVQWSQVHSHSITGLMIFTIVLRRVHPHDGHISHSHLLFPINMESCSDQRSIPNNYDVALVLLMYGFIKPPWWADFNAPNKKQII